MHIERGFGQRASQGAVCQHGLWRGRGQARLLLRGQGRAEHGARAGLRAWGGVCVCVFRHVQFMFSMCTVTRASGGQARLL